MYGCEIVGTCIYMWGGFLELCRIKMELVDNFFNVPGQVNFDLSDLVVPGDG